MAMRAGEAAAEMQRVCDAIHGALRLAAAVDQVRAALELTEVQYSPLRTTLEHADQAAERVMAFLRANP